MTKTKTAPEEITQDELDGMIETKAAELAAKVVEKKFAEAKAAGLFIGSNVVEKATEGIKVRTAKMIRAAKNKDADELSKLRAAEPTHSNSASIVPQEWVNEIIKVLKNYGLVSALARVIPMNTQTINLTKGTNQMTFSAVGDTQAGTGSYPVLTPVTLTVVDQMGIALLPNSLIEDASIDLTDLLEAMLQNALSQSIDARFLATGATGILNPSISSGLFQTAGMVTLGTGKTTLSSGILTIKDLITLQAAPHEAAIKNGVYMMSNGAWLDLLATNSNTALSNLIQAFPGGPITVAGETTGVKAVGTIAGKLVYTTSLMPGISASATPSAVVAVFGDLSYLTLGIRKDLEITISENAVVNGVSAFETNQTAVRGLARFEVVPTAPECFARLQLAAS